MMNYTNPNDNWLSSEMMKKLKPEEAQAVGCLTIVGYFVAIVVGLCLCSLLGSCKTCDCGQETIDSIRIDTKTEIVYVPDTTYITIPAEKESVVVKDSTSHLENDYATSDARINPDGTLFHQLATKPQKKPVEVDKKIELRYSIVYVEKSNTETGQQIVEVERQLSWWEKTRIYGFYLLAALLILIYRKPIWSLLRKFILRMPH